MHEWVVLILPTQTEYCAVHKIGLSCSTKELIIFMCSLQEDKLNIYTQTWVQQ